MIVWRLTIMDAIDDRFGKIVVAASLHRHDAHFDNPRLQHPDSLGRGVGQIDDPTFHKRPPIIDPDRYRSSVVETCHLDPGSKPQPSVGRRISLSIIAFAAGRSTPLKAIGIVTGKSNFGPFALRRIARRGGAARQDQQSDHHQKPGEAQENTGKSRYRRAKEAIPAF